MKPLSMLLPWLLFFFTVPLNAQIIINGEGNLGVKTSYPGEALHLESCNFLQTPSNPRLVGSIDIGPAPRSVFLSGRYAYVIDEDSEDLKVIDVSNPVLPEIVGSIGIGPMPSSLFVSGRYAYVVDTGSEDLTVIDVSDPSFPSLVGSLDIGSGRHSVFVSGPYAYVVDIGSHDLKVIDVSDPTAPSLAESLGIGSGPSSVFVSGRYAYVVDTVSEDLKVIDVSEPTAPSMAGSLAVGTSPRSVFVSGRYAYVVDAVSDDLKVIDVSDPTMPSEAGSLPIGASPQSVFVSGRYAYVVDTLSDDLKVIDVSDPSALSLAGSLDVGPSPLSVFVSGRYAYVVDTVSDDLKVIDVTGAEVTALMAHSLEAGQVQVLGDVVAQGQLRVNSSVSVGSGGFNSDGPVSLERALRTRDDKVGIGTNDPDTRLHVQRGVSSGASLKNHVAAIENTSTGQSPDVLMLKVNIPNPDIGVNFITFADSSGNLGSIEGDGTGGISLNSSGGDFAEYLPKRDPGEKIAAGDIVGLFGDGVSKQTKASVRLMVVSTAPIVLGNRPDTSFANQYVPVAFVGQVPVKVAGPVKPGDFIVASDQADGIGYAVPPDQITSKHFSLIVGCAMEESSDENPELITALVGLPLKRSLAEILGAKENRIARLESRLAILENLINAHFAADGQDAGQAFIH